MADDRRRPWSPVPRTTDYIPPGTWVAPRRGRGGGRPGRDRRAGADPRRRRRPAARRVGAPARRRQPAPRGRRDGPARRRRSRAPRARTWCVRRAPGTPIQHRLAIVVSDPPPAAGRRLEPRGSPGAGRAATGGMGPAGAGRSGRGGDHRRREDAGRRRPVRPGRALRQRRRERREEHARRPHPTGWSSLPTCPGWRSTWEVAGLLRTTLSRGRPIDVADLGRADGEDLVGRAPPTPRRSSAAPRWPRTVWRPQSPPARPPRSRRTGSGRRPPTPAHHCRRRRRRSRSRRCCSGPSNGSWLPKHSSRAPRAAGDPPAPKVVAELGGQALAAVFGTGFVAVPVIAAAARRGAGPVGRGSRPVRRDGPRRAPTSGPGWPGPAPCATPLRRTARSLLVREAYGTPPCCGLPRPRRPRTPAGSACRSPTAVPAAGADRRAWSSNSVGADLERRGRRRRARRVDRGRPAAPGARRPRQPGRAARAGRRDHDRVGPERQRARRPAAAERSCSP